MDLAGRHVLLTGGSRGLGPVIADALARRGAHLALVARSEEDLERVGASLRPLGVRVVAVPADLASAPDRERAVERVVAELGGVDVLVNNAAMETGGAFVDLEWTQIQDTLEVNLAAPVHLTHLVLPHMLRRSRGHVVHISSLAGRVGTPYDAVYSGTKAALTRWGEGLRREMAHTAVRISTVFPGYVTEVGMFARFGLRPPALVGSCTPAQVAAGVVRAVERDLPEVIVNSLPLRPAFALAELSPRLADWLMRRMGVVEFQRRKVGAPPPSGAAGAPDLRGSPGRESNDPRPR